MQLRKLAPGAVLLGAVAFSSFALGQQAATPDEQQIATADAQMQGLLGADKLWDGAKTATSIYEKASGDPVLTKAVVQQALVGQNTNERQGRELAKLAALQVAQNQKLIEQNQRIIELLEKNGKKN